MINFPYVNLLFSSFPRLTSHSVHGHLEINCLICKLWSHLRISYTWFVNFISMEIFVGLVETWKHAKLCPWTSERMFLIWKYSSNLQNCFVLENFKEFSIIVKLAYTGESFSVTFWNNIAMFCRKLNNFTKLNFTLSLIKFSIFILFLYRAYYNTQEIPNKILNKRKLLKFKW